MNRFIRAVGLLLCAVPFFVLYSYAQAPQTITDTPRYPTYGAAVVAATAAATATDIMCVSGSATKTVYVWQMQVTGIATTATTTDLQTVKRSTANSGGTAVAMTAVPLDSADAAATATVYYYTANAAALGTAVGSLHADKYTLTAATGAPANTILPYNYGTLGDTKPVVLRGTAQSICFNLNGVTPAGTVFSGDVHWTEQ